VIGHKKKKEKKKKEKEKKKERKKERPVISSFRRNVNEIFGLFWCVT